MDVWQDLTLSEGATPTAMAGSDWAFEPIDLGLLHLPTGHLVVADPFQGMTRRGMPTLTLPAGDYRVLGTLARRPGEKAPVERWAGLTLVLDEDAWSRRLAWQQRWLERDVQASIPEEARLPLVHEDAEAPWLLAAPSGVVVVLDAQSLQQGMPFEVTESPWFETVFDHGVEHSWFDALDSAQPPGASAVVLPRLAADPSGRCLAVACSTGWGAGTYGGWFETTFDTQNGPWDAAEGRDEALEALERDARTVAVHFTFWDEQRPFS